MKRYIAHIKSKPTHERRQHAAQISAGIVAVVFVVWISTIGIRFSSNSSETASNGVGNQIANIISGTQQNNATLIVATTTQ